MITPFILLGKRELDSLDFLQVIFTASNEVAASILGIKFFRVRVKLHKHPLMMKLVVTNKGINVDVRAKGLGNLEKFEELDNGIGSKLMKLHVVEIKNQWEAIVTGEPKPSVEIFLEH